jgi:molecular chaperone DnaK (HSP70)
MRYLIGIDLGTTNSAVAYVDTQQPPFAIRPFSIPQFSSLGRVESLASLPSFCYLIAKDEWPPGSLKLPWKEEEATFVGHFAKIQGARVPTRLIQSAKSWLCNVAANRKDRILPIEAADIQQRLSPIEATAKYLTHLKEAWNATIAKGDIACEFAEQEIILTVPASFDEVARMLTVEAARLAGLQHLTLLEEPQAAFYSWIAQHEAQWKTLLQAGDRILVCDVGGGTTDFSLIEVQSKNEDLTFQRMSVGNHLLLGGDNMDAALAHYVEQKMEKAGNTALDSTQWHQLCAEVRAAKEFLLEPHVAPHDTYTIVLQGASSSVIKSSLTVNVQRQEIEKILIEGFFSQHTLEEALQRNKSRGFRTVGLPYEDEPSITKHLAHFLQQAHYLDKGVDYLLFNGGTLKPKPFQMAIKHVLERWFPHKEIGILSSTSLDLAVARGAAYYAKARRGIGIRIGGGIARTYYLKIDVQEGTDKVAAKALTLLPRGSEEGATFEADQIFHVRPNTPVAFHLLTSHVRIEDQLGQIVEIDEQEMQDLPPIHTVLRFGRKQAALQEKIPVRLALHLTPIGTLELWLKSSTHQWKLEFQLRTATGQDNSLTDLKKRQDETFESDYLTEAKQLIEELFLSRSFKPALIFEKLEEQLQSERKEWSSSILRQLWEPLLKCAPQRKITPEHEARWWNLAGFFLRPGFGFPLDDFRLKELWKIILSELKQPKTTECHIQQWICYRRIAGGLNKGQQMQIASEIIPTLFDKKSNKIEIKGRGELYAYSEKIRALAAFERLDLSLKQRLAEAILMRIQKKSAILCDYWALGRIGARHLAYGSVGQVIPKEICTVWVEQLLQADISEGLLFALGQLMRKTDQRELNMSDSLIAKVKARDKCFEDLSEQPRPLTISEQEFVLGDRLPAGLTLELL